MLFLLAALAHSPHFDVASHVTIDAEPSQVLYLDKPTTVTVQYQSGDFMYVLLLRPWKKSGGVITGSCPAGTPATDSHATVYEPGATIYELWTESTYSVVTTHIHSERANSSQSCTFYVDSTLPTAFVVGTKEEGFLELFAVGLPWYTMRVSAWANDYWYYVGVGGVMGVWFLLCAILWYLYPNLNPSIIASGTFGLTALQRLVQLFWSKPGIGLLWTLQPLTCAVLCFNYPILCAILCIAPERSWIDVAVFFGVTIWKKFRATVPKDV